MHRLSAGFILGYHGCARPVADRLLGGEAFAYSANDYDWLGQGIYFWEANPLRGLEFAMEALRRRHSDDDPCVIGAVIEYGNCLDLTTSVGIRLVQRGFSSLKASAEAAGRPLPRNSSDRDHLRRNLDCVVIERVHEFLLEGGAPPFDTAKGVFTEGTPAYEGGAILEKTHIQIAVRNPAVIKGVFRVPDQHLRPIA